MFSSQLVGLRGDSDSVKTLQGTIQALERDRANLQERVQRLEKDLPAGSDAINKASGKSGLNIIVALQFMPSNVTSRGRPDNLIVPFAYFQMMPFLTN